MSQIRSERRQQRKDPDVSHDALPGKAVGNSCSCVSGGCLDPSPLLQGTWRSTEVGNVYSFWPWGSILQKDSYKWKEMCERRELEATLF